MLLHLLGNINLHCGLILQTEDTEEGAEPSWERREAMVRKLQRKFPDQDKEVRGTLFRR